MIFMVFISLLLAAYKEGIFLDAGYSMLLLLAYTTLGFKKLMKPEWRNGAAGLTILRDPT